MCLTIHTSYMLLHTVHEASSVSHNTITATLNRPESINMRVSADSPERSEMEDHINASPGEQVFGNSLIMEKVYSSVGSADLTNCMIACKDGFESAVKARYKDVSEDLQVRLAHVNCPLVSNGELRWMKRDED